MHRIVLVALWMLQRVLQEVTHEIVGGSHRRQVWVLSVCRISTTAIERSDLGIVSAEGLDVGASQSYLGGELDGG